MTEATQPTDPDLAPAGNTDEKPASGGRYERPRRIRKSPQERKSEIVKATAKLIAQKGYNGISLKDVADELHMTQQGVLHYVKNKAGLLSLLITDIYDRQGTPEDFAASGLPGSDPSGMLLPAYFRFLVKHNSQRRMLVQLYTVLEAEALQPGHPLYDYFQERPIRVWDYYSEYTWRLPDSVGGWDNMRSLVRKSIEAMDGIQLRWLREPPISLYDEWIEFEYMIFPSPVWDTYRS